MGWQYLQTERYLEAEFSLRVRQRLVKTDEQKDSRRKCENTAGNTVFYEASQKNPCRWLLKATEANTEIWATNITMTCSLCSDHAICYACIFSSAFEMMMCHWFMLKIAKRLAITSLHSLFVIYMWEQLESVWTCWEEPISLQWDPIYD